jgi:tetratricopeptide (TPR) repeat protein
MSNELIQRHAKELYSLASSQKTTDSVYAIQLFELLMTSGDPYYIPFALTGIAQCYSYLGQKELATATLKRITQLPKQHQLLLSPVLLAICYQRTGDLTEARKIHAEIYKQAPNELTSISALAELSLLQGDFDEGDVLARKLKESIEPRYQILARMISALTHAVRGEHEQAGKELHWVGKFLTSSGSLPEGRWDYSDLEPLIVQTGPSRRAFQVLIDALNGRIAIPEFVTRWSEMMSPAQIVS